MASFILAKAAQPPAEDAAGHLTASIMSVSRAEKTDPCTSQTLSDRVSLLTTERREYHHSASVL